MIPIEKNIIVTDVNGNQIGLTYPKRAKGLVKNGRAEYAGDREIRLKDTRIPTVDIYTEEDKMSKVINFNARDFRFEDSCSTNVGVRGFMTYGGGNTEVWEIGDWGWNWTQIARDITGLEKNTDYIFRFAMTGGHTDDDKEVSLVHIFHLGDLVTSDPIQEDEQFVPLDEYHNPKETNQDGAQSGQTDDIVLPGRPLYRYNSQEEHDRAWNERYTYCIGKSRFEPVLSKRDKTGMLRVFELPFNTGEYENWRIIIVAQHAIARFFAPKDNAYYSELEDLSFEQWRRERTEQLAMEQQAVMDPLGIGKHLNPGNGQAAKPFVSGGTLNLQGAEIHSRSIMRELIELAKQGMKVDLNGAMIDCEDDED